MAYILVRCPYTGFNVQHWLEDAPSPDGGKSTYEGFVCPACNRVHFLNRSTGKLYDKSQKT
jgi:anaerobic ribonucleoside-triphosphate reductase